MFCSKLKSKTKIITEFLIAIGFVYCVVKLLNKESTNDNESNTKGNEKETETGNNNNEKNNYSKIYEEYFEKFYKSQQTSLLLDYLMFFRSIKVDDIESLKKKYSKFDNHLLKLNITSEEIMSNLISIKKYLLDFINKTNSSFKPKDDDYTYLMNEVEKIQKAKANKDILDELKDFISFEELEKWEDYYKNLNN